MFGPGDWMAAGPRGRSRLRASEADRDQAVDVLKAAFVSRRLAKDEFELRVGRVLAARTYADLDALTADIPPGPSPLWQPVAVETQPHRGNLVAPEAPASPLDHRGTRAFVHIAQAALARRQFISLVAGLVLVGAGIMLPSTVAFIAGIVVVGLCAPQGLPWTPSGPSWSPEAAMVRTWRWLYRTGPLTPSG